MAVRESVVRVLVDTDASGAGAKLGRFGKIAGAAALGVGAVAVGGALAAKKIYEIGDASDDANTRIAQINKQMGLFGNQTEKVNDRITKYAEKVGRATGIDANSIKATQAKLLTFRALAKTADTVGGAFDRTTMAAIDLAASGFGTAEGNALQLGKALQDPANKLTALGRTGALTEAQIKKIGDEFKRTGDITAAQGQILDAVEKQVGGVAEATAGGFERMQESFRQGGDALAKKFLPYLDKFGDWLVDKGLPAAKELADQIGEKLGPAFRRVGEFIVEKVIPAARRFYEWFVEKIAPGIKRTVEPIIDGLKKAFDKVKKAVGDNEPQLRDLFEALKKVAEFIADKVMPVVGKLLGKQLEIMGTNIGIAIGIISGLVDAFNKVKDAVNAVIDAIGNLKDKLSGDFSLGDFMRGNATSDLFGRGTVAGGALPVGVAGAGFGGGAVVVNVNGFVGDEVKLAGEIRRVLRDDVLRFGGQTP